MSEPDAAVKLRVPRQTLVDSCHANEYQADVGAIKEIAQKLERRR